jgi:Uma2 family endonuclease
MSDAKPRVRATYQDVRDAPEHSVAEILDGELVLSPRPALPHVSVMTELSAFLRTRFGRRGQPGGWLILVEPELHLADHVVVPDLAGWRLDRADQVDVSRRFTVIRPDWVCETLSPWTERFDRRLKLRIYAEHAVGHAWYVHPLRRTLEVMRRQESMWLTVAVHGDDDVVRAEPFDQLELDLAALWADQGPPPSRASELAARYQPGSAHELDY